MNHIKKKLFTSSFILGTVLISVGMNNQTFADDCLSPGCEETVTVTVAGKKTLCPKGQYVAKCGSYRVGFNWLREIKVNKPYGNVYTIRDKYNDETKSKSEVMRDFFAIQSDDRDYILNNMCNPYKVRVSCAKCPSDGDVDESEYDPDPNNSPKWTFHTVADCKITEFQDSTGKYKYFDNNVPKTFYVSGDNDTFDGDEIKEITIPNTTAQISE